MGANGGENTRASDDRHRRVVVVLLLSAHPAARSETEVEREVAEDGSFGGRDAVARAIRDLVAAGVVQRRDRALTLSRAACATATLLEGW